MNFKYLMENPCSSISCDRYVKGRQRIVVQTPCCLAEHPKVEDDWIRALVTRVTHALAAYLSNSGKSRQEDVIAM